MNAAAAILERVKRLGVSIRADGGELVLRHKPGTLTPDLIETLKANKPAILAALTAPSTPDSDVVARQRWGLPPSCELPMADERPDLHRVDAARLRNAMDRQPVEAIRWVLARANDYAKARTWTPFDCDLSAVLDLLLWQRELRLSGATREARTIELAREQELIDRIAARTANRP